MSVISQPPRHLQGVYWPLSPHFKESPQSPTEATRFDLESSNESEGNISAIYLFV